jgi:peptide/nickel transport system substrate-binding protein
LASDPDFTSVRFRLVGLILAAGAPPLPARPECRNTAALTTSTVHPTISVQTWDPADWNWKNAQDTGPFYEGLLSADLTRAKRLGGKYAFVADAWIPTDAVRGELAESWEWKENPMRLEVKLRKGVRFPEKPGVMKSRELVADDVVFSYKRMDASRRRSPPTRP